MSIVTLHWSASLPVRLHAYHIEAARKADLSQDFLHNLRALALQPTGFHAVPWNELASYFNIWKNDALSGITDYGTWDNNSDLRDGTPNIEIAAMCMANATTTNFGSEPFTIAHAWLLAAITARVCHLKGLDPLGSFAPSVAPAILQNGPIYVVSTHGERAVQTKDYGVPGGSASSRAASDEFGYFVGSGDPDSRWDLTILDPAYIAQGQQVTPKQAHDSAAWLRRQANAILQQAKAEGFTGGMWGVDGNPS